MSSMARRVDEDRDFDDIRAQLNVFEHVEGIGEGEEDMNLLTMGTDSANSSLPQQEGTAHEGTINDGQEEIEMEEMIVEEGEGYAELSLTIPSDSASEEPSSDLSLPHSFGHYDQMSIGRGISHFDDHLTSFPSSGPVNRLQRFAQGTGPKETHSSSSIDGREAVMKQFYEIQVGKIRTQLVLSVQAQKELEKTLQQERMMWRKKEVEQEHLHTAEQSQADRELKQAQSDLQAAQKQLMLEKTHFASLQISDALAEQLARQKEEDLSIREYIQLSVYSKVRNLEVELERCRQSMEVLEKSSRADRAAAADATDEVAQVQRINEAKERRLQHDLELSEATRQELESQIKTLVNQVDSMKQEQQRNESLFSDQRGLQTQSERMKRDLIVLQREYDDLKLRFDATSNESSDLHQKIELLTADKRFLQDVKTQLEEQVAKLGRSQQEMQEKADALQKKHDGNLRQSVQLQAETRLHFEKKMDDEMLKFMELSKREIERIRNDGQVVYERENRLLKEARDDALKHVEMLQARLKSVQSALDEKILEATRTESSHTTALATANNELKMRHFEMSQLKLTLEDKALTARNAQREVDMLAQKVNALKEEFARLETTSTTRITQLEASLEVERSKLKEYELLEIDLDGAIMQTGEIAAGGGCDGKQATATDSTLQDVMTTFGAIPTTTKRRFQQSVLLAQKVVKSQREAIALEQKLHEVTSDHAKLQQEAAQLKVQLANLHQPQSYLIDKLARREQELKVTAQKCHDTELQLRQLRAQYQQVRDANTSLQHQLQQLLARREDLDALKSTVQVLRGKLNTTSTSKQLTAPPQPLQMVVNACKVGPTTATSSSIAPPTPSIASKMTHHQKNDSVCGRPASVALSSSISSTPRWYTKLRTPVQQHETQ